MLRAVCFPFNWKRRLNVMGREEPRRLMFRRSAAPPCWWRCSIFFLGLLVGGKAMFKLRGIKGKLPAKSHYRKRTRFSSTFLPLFGLKSILLFMYLRIYRLILTVICSTLYNCVHPLISSGTMNELLPTYRDLI